MAKEMEQESEVDNDSYDPEDHEASMDADTLARAQEIRGDKDRHQKALSHLNHKAKSARSASANEKRAFTRRTGERMKKAFSSKTSPFQATTDKEANE